MADKRETVMVILLNELMMKKQSMGKRMSGYWRREENVYFNNIVKESRTNFLVL